MPSVASAVGVRLRRPWGAVVSPVSSPQPVTGVRTAVHPPHPPHPPHPSHLSAGGGLARGIIDTSAWTGPPAERLEQPGEGERSPRARGAPRECRAGCMPDGHEPRRRRPPPRCWCRTRRSRAAQGPRVAVARHDPSPTAEPMRPTRPAVRRTHVPDRPHQPCAVSLCTGPLGPVAAASAGRRGVPAGRGAATTPVDPPRSGSSSSSKAFRAAPAPPDAVSSATGAAAAGGRGRWSRRCSTRPSPP